MLQRNPVKGMQLELHGRDVHDSFKSHGNTKD